MNGRTGLLLAAATIAACGGAAPTSARAPSAEDARESWTAWRARRREELVGDDGWLALVGLFWLTPGESTIGSDPASAIVLPAPAPAHVGRVVVDGDVRFAADPSARVVQSGAPITETTLSTDPSAPPLEIGSLRMVLIARGDRLALRVRDLASPARASFGELPVYDYDPRLRIRAQVRAPESGRVLSLVNVLGMQIDEPCVALLDLVIEGTPVRLAASEGGGGADDRYFVMLRDATASEGETYPAGRYLDVPAPDADGATWVDLNRLYTPPCGYTSFATCPLPPEENVLDVPIRAGERYARHDP